MTRMTQDGENSSKRKYRRPSAKFLRPQEAVLPAFLHVRETGKSVSVTPREKEIIEIKQEMDLLRREVRRGSLGTEERNRTIGPDEARARIESYLIRGYTSFHIVSRLEPLGPPPSWIKNEITLARKRLKRTKSAKSGVPTDAGEVDGVSATLKG